MTIPSTQTATRHLALQTVKAVLVFLLLAALAVELDALAALLLLRTLR